jgi:hypothetical protein
MTVLLVGIRATLGGDRFDTGIGMELILFDLLAALKLFGAVCWIAWDMDIAIAVAMGLTNS